MTGGWGRVVRWSDDSWQVGGAGWSSDCHVIDRWGRVVR